MNRFNVRGFTIAELLLATAFFSIVILLALSAFFEMGRVYYRGVSQTQTQQVVDQIVAHLQQDLAHSASVNGPNDSSVAGVKYYCLGNIRYTYTIDNEIDATKTQYYNGPTLSKTNIGLLRDSLPGDNACGDPAAVALVNPTELLADKNRIYNFDISKTPDASLLWSVDVKVAYGDDGALDEVNKTCNSNSERSQYCAVAETKTAISRAF